MVFNQPRQRNLRKLILFCSKSHFYPIISQNPLNCLHTQKQTYVNVYMKWKRDSYFEKIDSIHKSIELKPIIAFKNFIAASQNGCIPISDVSKKGLQFDVKIKVARFLRQYPSVFEEFIGPQYNLPWFRLTPEAVMLNEEEEAVYRDFKDDLQERLKKFILMSPEKRLPLKIIQGMQWYLGLPDDYLRNPEENLDGCFKVVEMEHGLKGLTVDNAKNAEKVLSVLQKNTMRTGMYHGGSMEAIPIPLFPSKGLRLRRKILDWLYGFQKAPYVSPYEDCSDLCPDSEIAEKRLVGLLHELLSLFVEHSAERKKLLCLRKYLGLPQKVHKAFERHPHVFYLSLKNKTCTAILKEPYCDKTAIEAHPLANVREKYIELVKKSKVLLRNRRSGNQSCNVKDDKLELNLGHGDDTENAGPGISL